MALPGRPAAPFRAGSRLAGWRAATELRLRRNALMRQRAVFACLATSVVVIGVLAVEFGPAVIAPVVILVPIMFGGRLLQVRRLHALLILAAVMIAYDVAVVGLQPVRPSAIIAVAVTAAFAEELARTRERLGMSRARSELMLMDLRDRLLRQGQPPTLPSGWHAEVALSSAAGGTFGGDFLVCRVSNDEGLLEVAMVDVSGKGVDAGTRALLLAGAVGGMLGSVPPDRFLGAANDFLLGLGWEEGFATAIHLALELPSGSFRLNAAGHVPAAHFVAGRGEWRLVEPAGPALGLLPDAQYVPVTGDLRASDALLLYTDGVIEVPGRDLAVGIDKLLGEAERQVPRGFDGAASRLLSVASVAIDDRAIFLIWRT